MLHPKLKILILLLTLIPSVASAQFGDSDKKLVINGYLVNMQSVSISKIPFEIPDSLDFLKRGDNNMYITDIYFQNRLNLFWYANDKLTISAQMRNRLMVGDQMRLDYTQQLENSFEMNGNFFNPSWNLAVGNSYILNMAFDRIYAEYSSGNLDLTVGKQRINWGKTFAFNPNDMFNTYSYFDFDYEEKPGTDAFRAMYYTGATSSIEFAANIDSASQVSAAVKWNANIWNYDFQFIGGTLKGEDLALGFGWSGYVKNSSWRGELAWYQPFENFADTSGVIMLSTGMDYSIGSKWTVQGEAMVAKLPKGKDIVFFDAYAPPQSVKDLATSPFQLLGSVMFQASPLSTLSLSSIWYPHPDIKGIFLGPSWTYSVADNFSASLYWQYFHGNFPNSITGEISKQSVNSGFLRLKYSF
nr:hypothetical protein [uncultured Carboxylicivirga sp.]